MIRSTICAGLVLLACNSKPGDAPIPVSDGAAPRAGLLAVGDAVPDVEATSHDGQPVKLRALVGKPVVVYFYPKDDTPGCTVEAQGLRDEWTAFESVGAVVIGVSTDDAASHRAFAQKHSLPFLLVPDERGSLAGAFGVPLMMGRSKRVTFVIDRSGKVAKVFPEVRPQSHAREVLAALRAHGG